MTSTGIAWAGLRTLVVGLARSGRAAAASLQRHGAQVTGVDGAQSVALRTSAEELRARGITIELGADLDRTEWLDHADVVVASPGVPPATGVLAEAVRRGIPVWGEPELAFRLNRGRSRLVAVTGTNGKTSTTELLAACLDAPAAGNIGSPLVARLDVDDPPELIVVELSSFQLTFTPTMRPEVAVVLNFAPDHLDWHGSVAAYADAKARVWRNQTAEQTTVLNGADPLVAAMAADHPPPGRIVRFRPEPPAAGEVGVEDGHLVSRLAGAPGVLAAVADMPATGSHHVANAAAAAAAALVAGADPEAVGRAVRAYRPGAHRLEVVAADAGVTWINDSKATNPHAAAAALGAFERVLWIAGGQNKDLDLTELVPTVAATARAVLAIGASAGEIAAVADAAGVPSRQVGTLERAVDAAHDLAESGDVVLFSPACASFDQFTDYAARGEAFRMAVAGAIGGPTPGRAGRRQG